VRKEQIMSSAVWISIVTFLIPCLFHLVRVFLESGSKRLHRKIEDALAIQSVGAAVAAPAVAEPSLPWEPTEEERLAYEKADHDRYRAEKRDWHNERLAMWDLDFEQALPLSERPVIEAEEVDNDREPLYSDGHIVAWGGMKIYDARPVQPPYIVAHERRKADREILKLRDEQARLQKKYQEQVKAMLAYANPDVSYDDIFITAVQ
jgi:hypothetical protein